MSDATSVGNLGNAGAPFLSVLQINPCELFDCVDHRMRAVSWSLMPKLEVLEYDGRKPLILRTHSNTLRRIMGYVSFPITLIERGSTERLRTEEENAIPGIEAR